MMTPTEEGKSYAFKVFAGPKLPAKKCNVNNQFQQIKSYMCR